MPPLNLFQSERLKNLLKANKDYYKIEYVFTLNILSFIFIIIISKYFKN